MLITLGSAESMARDLAKRYDVQVIDGPTLWPKVQNYLPASVGDGVRSSASTQARKGLWMGAIASVVLGIVTFVISDFSDSGDIDAVASMPASSVLSTAHPVPPPVDPTVQKINDTARAMAQVANLTDQQRAERRVQAAKQISGIAEIARAGWSTQSTLQLQLKQVDDSDLALVDEVCRILTQYEELRYTRVQLDPPEDSNEPVHWRQCQ
jgi:hypothetical protein